MYYAYKPNGAQKGWHPRQKGSVIGWMHVAHPSHREHFYLRTLLCYKTGVRSYRDLYRVNGQQYECPTDACRAMGLMPDDSQWKLIFTELKDNTLGWSLRQTLATALKDGAISEPQKIWDQFKADFCGDVPTLLERNANWLQFPDHMT